MIEYETNCAQTSIDEWDELMLDAKDTDGKELRKLIEKYIPELYEGLALEFPNPYEENSQETKTHYIYVHSATEYFLRKVL